MALPTGWALTEPTSHGGVAVYRYEGVVLKDCTWTAPHPTTPGTYKVHVEVGASTTESWHGKGDAPRRSPKSKIGITLEVIGLPQHLQPPHCYRAQDAGTTRHGSVRRLVEALHMNTSNMVLGGWMRK